MDKKSKKAVLQKIPYGAYVVGTKSADGSDHLMFATWLMQTSFKPPLVALALSEDSRTLANVRREGTFTVSFLTEALKDSAQEVLDEAFDKVPLARSPTGLAVLKKSAGWIECKLIEVVDRGDHRVVLAEVADADGGMGRLLPLEALGWHYGG